MTRLEIEKLVLNHVFDSVQDADIKDIQDNILKAKKMIESNIPAFDENIQFQKLLAKASKNHVFVIVMESIMAVVAHSLSRLRPEFEVSLRTIREHEEILGAIIKRDREKAIAFLEKHILEVGNRFQGIIEQTEVL